MAMTIIAVKREASGSIKSGERAPVISFQEQYIVQTDDIVRDIYDVIDGAVTNADTITYLPDGTLPEVDNTTWGNYVCRSLTGERQGGNPRIWVFTCEWSTEVRQGTQGPPSGEVTTYIPLRKAAFEPVRRTRVKDYGRRTYVNGAGSLYTPALQVDEEIGVWYFSQFEPVADANAYTTTEPYGYIVDSGTQEGRVVPPGVYEDNTYSTMIGVTDSTIAFFNGAINHKAFLGYPPWTLKLEVRDSTVGYFYGAWRRLTEYTLKLDFDNWLDKPLNAGPYFLAPKLLPGDVPSTIDFQLHDYIYKLRDVESDDVNLSQDESGPLGFIHYHVPSSTYIPHSVKLFPTLALATSYRTLFDSGDLGSIQTIELASLNGVNPTRIVFYDGFSNRDGFPLHIKGVSNGYELVKTRRSRSAYRAGRMTNLALEWPHVEYLRNNTFDFTGYMRVI